MHRPDWKRSLTWACVLLFSLGLAACDGEAEDAAEDTGDAIEDAAENTEDAVEDAVD